MSVRVLNWPYRLVALSLAVLMSHGGLAAWADVLHFYQGAHQRGKIYRVTGELIEFKPEDARGDVSVIRRIRLSDRRDVVEMRDGQKHFGEILYADRFKIDLQTAQGNRKLSRWRVKNLVMGSPSQNPLSGFPYAPEPSERLMMPGP